MSEPEPAAAAPTVSGGAQPPRTPGRRAHAIALGVVLALCGAHLLGIARQGWIPHDEGLLLQCAQRVLAGEVPHRDFDECYTGGLTYLHAAALSLPGGDLLAMRLPFLLAAWLALPVIYALAARAVRPAGAALVTLAAYAWGPPLYVASMPTWWVTFLTLAGALALLRWHDDRRPRWLVLAGACAGLGLAVKVVALYALAGLVLALVHDEQAEDAARPAGDPRRAWSAVVVLGASAFALVALATLRRRLGSPEVLHLLLPPLAAAGALVAFEVRAGRGEARVRARALARRLGPLLFGFALPVLVLCAGFLAAGALPDLWRGTFVAPMQARMQAAVMAPPRVDGWTFVALAPALLLVAASDLARGRPRGAVVGATVVAGLAMLADLAQGADEASHLLVWLALRLAIPVGVVAAAATLARADLEPRARAGLAATALPLGVLALVQFPYAYGIYLGYVAPLAVLAWAHLLRARPGREAVAPLHACVLAFLVAFAALWVWRCDVRSIGGGFAPARARARLDLPRGGLDVPEAEAALHAEVVAEVDRHAAPGAAIWAGPDCPQVYALPGRPNPTRTMYDAFDADFADPAARAARIQDTLELRDVRVVVLGPPGEFSGPLDPTLRDVLVARYPQARQVGPFEVRWR